MEELKMLVDMVAKLPAMALWVLIGFWAYKVIVVGSIYGLIRFCVDKLYLWLTTPKHTLEVKNVQVRPILDGLAIEGQLDALVGQLHRVRLHTQAPHLSYMHGDAVDWLRQAIDDKIVKDAAK